jgi:hypothetical protein
MTDPDYWTGHDAKADTELVQKFFNGWVIFDQKTGRGKSRQLERNSPSEVQAIDALRRLLGYVLKRILKGSPSHGPRDDVAVKVLLTLSAALDPESNSHRRVEFKLRKGNRSDSTSDLQILLHVGNLCMKGEKRESAVASAMKAFQLSRANVFAALRRAKARFRKLGIPDVLSIE